MRGSGPGGLLSQGVDRPSMLLGADFLRSHRVLVSHSQRKLYFTYLGGPVFQSREPSTSKDPDRAIADYDAAIRSDPQNAAAYFHRANAWGVKKDYDRAIADYDASMRIEPNRARCLRTAAAPTSPRATMRRASPTRRARSRSTPGSCWPT